jgi:hypothetical protein
MPPGCPAQVWRVSNLDTAVGNIGFEWPVIGNGSDYGHW